MAVTNSGTPTEYNVTITLTMEFVRMTDADNMVLRDKLTSELFVLAPYKDEDKDKEKKDAPRAPAY